MKLQQIIERHWYQRRDPLLTIILFPFSLIFESGMYLRKLLFALRLKRKSKLTCPVVVIGNISVGGAGKTPLTKAIAAELADRGYRVGIILRGYKGSNRGPRLVTANNDSQQVGDEALIYAQAGLPVAIGSRRVAAGELLLNNYPDLQLILADDGLQHYYLQRDFEICVVDSSRMFGNQELLPLGPLREPLTRLKKVNAIVVNGSYNKSKLREKLANYKTPIYYQELEFIRFINPHTGQQRQVNDFSQQKILAMAAIGNPGRFFDYLEKLGLKLNTWRIFPDHYHYQNSDIPAEYAIITTEKDYTKLAAFDSGNIWVTVVHAKLDQPELINRISQLITKGN